MLLTFSFLFADGGDGFALYSVKARLAKDGVRFSAVGDCGLE